MYEQCTRTYSVTKKCNGNLINLVFTRPAFLFYFFARCLIYPTQSLITFDKGRRSLKALLAGFVEKDLQSKMEQYYK